MSSMEINTICPDCGHQRVRTIQVYQGGKWFWMNGCNNCTWEEIIGDVDED